MTPTFHNDEHFDLMQENKFLKFLSFMWNPLSWVMEAAAVMAIVLANGGVSLLDPSKTTDCTIYHEIFFLPHFATLIFLFTVIILLTKPFFKYISGAGS